MTIIDAAVPTKTCSIDGCDGPHLALGWCDPHYRRYRRHGDPLGGRHFTEGCRVDDCENPHDAKGLCALHYERMVRHGDPEWTPGEVDDIAVERAVRADRPEHLTVAEREEVVRRLNRLGFTDGRIAEHLDIGTSGVWAIRRRLGLPARADGRQREVAA